jgi:hypothetical protein
VDQHFKDLLEASSVGTSAARRIRSSTPADVVEDVRRRLMERNPLQARARAAAARSQLLSAAADGGAHVAAEQPPGIRPAVGRTAPGRRSVLRTSDSRRDPVVFAASSTRTLVDGRSRLSALIRLAITADDLAGATARCQALRVFLDRSAEITGDRSGISAEAVTPIDHATADQRPDQVLYHEADAPGLTERGSPITAVWRNFQTAHIMIVDLSPSTALATTDPSIAESVGTPDVPDGVHHAAARYPDLAAVDVYGVNYDEALACLHELLSDCPPVAAAVIQLGAWHDSAAENPRMSAPTVLSTDTGYLWYINRLPVHAWLRPEVGERTVRALPSQSQWDQQDVVHERKMAQLMYETWADSGGGVAEPHFRNALERLLGCDPDGPSVGRFYGALASRPTGDDRARAEILTRLAGSSESDALDGLLTAAADTGCDTVGPVTEEVVAAVLAAVLIERSSLGDSAARQLRNRTAHRDVAGAIEAWRHRAEIGPAHPAAMHDAYSGSSFSAENSEQHRRPLTEQNCTVLVTDVLGFGSHARKDEDRRIIREALFNMTRTALRSIPVWSRDDRGDGQLIVIPPSVPIADVIEQLHKELPGAIQQYNSTRHESAQIQLRVAVNVGPVFSDTMGVSGEATIVSERLVEAPAFKEAIAKNTASLGIIASTSVYETVIKHVRDPADLAAYSQIRVNVKESSITAWMRLFNTEQAPRQIRGGEVPSVAAPARARRRVKPAARNDPSVVALVARATEGDQGAWMELVDRYAPLVYTICARYRLSNDDIEDVGQNVWLLLVDQIGKLREPAALPGWLATTTARECLRVVTASRKSEQPGTKLDDSLQFVDNRVIEEEMDDEQLQAAVREWTREIQAAPSWFVETSKKAYA